MADVWGLKRSPTIGQEVVFQMPVANINKGIVYGVDGSYCYIRVNDLHENGKPVEIERYWESEMSIA